MKKMLICSLFKTKDSFSDGLLEKRAVSFLGIFVNHLQNLTACIFKIIFLSSDSSTNHGQVRVNRRNQMSTYALHLCGLSFPELRYLV